MKTAFINTNLIDVLNGKLIPNCTVISNDGIITDILEASSTTTLSDANSFDCNFSPIP